MSHSLSGVQGRRENRPRLWCGPTIRREEHGTVRNCHGYGGRQARHTGLARDGCACRGREFPDDGSGGYLCRGSIRLDIDSPGHGIETVTVVRVGTKANQTNLTERTLAQGQPASGFAGPKDFLQGAES